MNLYIFFNIYLIHFKIVYTFFCILIFITPQRQLVSQLNLAFHKQAACQTFKLKMESLKRITKK